MRERVFSLVFCWGFGGAGDEANVLQLKTNKSFGGASGSPVQVAYIVGAPTVVVNRASLAQDAPTLVITGTNFDPAASGNLVVLNFAAGTVTSATATQLTVTLTAAPTSVGVLTAVVNTIGGTSGRPVQVATVVNPPTVTPNAANTVAAAPLIITGTGFDTTVSGNSVTLNLGAGGTVTSATANELSVTLSTPPTNLGALTAVVTSFGGSSGYPVQVATLVDSTCSLSVTSSLSYTSTFQTPIKFQGGVIVGGGGGAGGCTSGCPGGSSGGGGGSSAVLVNQGLVAVASGGSGGDDGYTLQEGYNGETKRFNGFTLNPGSSLTVIVGGGGGAGGVVCGGAGGAGFWGGGGGGGYYVPSSGGGGGSGSGGGSAGQYDGDSFYGPNPGGSESGGLGSYAKVYSYLTTALGGSKDTGGSPGTPNSVVPWPCCGGGGGGGFGAGKILEWLIL